MISRRSFLSILFLAPFAAKAIIAAPAKEPGLDIIGFDCETTGEPPRWILRNGSFVVCKPIDSGPLRGFNERQAKWDNYFHLRDNGLI